MSLLKHLEGYVSENVKIGRTLILLIKSEAKLAGMSIFPLIINICMLFVIILSGWFSAIILLGYYFYFLFNNAFLAIFLVLFINVMLLFLLLVYLRYNLRAMSFENTRKMLSKKEIKNEKL